MEIQSTVTEQVVVRFTVTDGDHSYSDALYFTPEEHAALDEKEIEAQQQKRFENWKTVVTAPPRKITDEEKQAQIVSLKEQLDATRDAILSALPDEAKKLAFLKERAAITAAQIAEREAAAPPVKP